MIAWVHCSACRLRHSSRPDGRCPRCGASVAPAERGAPATAPLCAPSPDVAPPPTPAVAPPPAPEPAAPGERAPSWRLASGLGAVAVAALVVAGVRWLAPGAAEPDPMTRSDQSLARALAPHDSLKPPPAEAAASLERLVGADGSYEFEVPERAWRESADADQGWFGRAADRVLLRKDGRATLAISHYEVPASDPVPSTTRELGWVRESLLARRVHSFSGFYSDERPYGFPGAVDARAATFRWEEAGEFRDAPVVAYVHGRDVFTVLAIMPDRGSDAALAKEVNRIVWSLRPKARDR